MPYAEFQDVHDIPLCTDESRSGSSEADRAVQKIATGHAHSERLRQVPEGCSYAPPAYGILPRVVEDFSELLRSARVQLGWDQGQVARHLGVGQQTVSRWERGETCPPKGKAPDIARVLCVEVQQVLDAMAISKSASRPSPYRSGRCLPSSHLGCLPRTCSNDSVQTWQLCSIRTLTSCHGYGSRGHKQYGIDIEICHPEGAPTGIQCKRAEEFGPADVQAAVAALTMDVRGVHDSSFPGKRPAPVHVKRLPSITLSGN